MKLYEMFVLMEARDYESPFKQIVDIAKSAGNDEMQFLVKDSISWAKTNLKRQDRIGWYLRYVKLSLLFYLKSILENYQLSDTVHNNREEFARVDSLLDRIRTTDYPALERKVKSETPLTSLSKEKVISSLREIRNTILHFISLDEIIPEAKNTVWKDQSFRELIAQFNEIEQKWKEERTQIIDINPDDKEILKINSKQSWWLLNRASCRAEGGAMGHCGNTASPSEGDRILSFRTRISDTAVRPNLTFILHKNGYLGEMKGRANQKPHAKYHPAIVSLLRKTDLIKGIEGGGYDPDNNFSINDLEDINTIKSLLELNPNLMSLTEMIIEFGTKNRDTRLRAIDYLKSNDIELVGESLVITTEKVDAKFIIKRWDSIDDLEEYKSNYAFRMAVSSARGDNMIEFDDLPVDRNMREELFDAFNTKHPYEIKKLKKYLEKEHQYDENDENYSNWIDFVESNSIDDIIDKANLAIIYGSEAGAESEMNDALIKSLRDSKYIYDERKIFDGSDFKLVVELDEIISQLLYYFDDLEQLIDNIAEDSTIDFSEPYDGWSGYDESTALEVLQDELWEIIK